MLKKKQKTAEITAPAKDIYESASCSGHSGYIVEVKTKKAGEEMRLPKRDSWGIHWEITNEWGPPPHAPDGDKAAWCTPVSDDLHIPKGAHGVMTHASAKACAWSFVADDFWRDRIDVRIRRVKINYSWEILNTDDVEIIGGEK